MDGAEYGDRDRFAGAENSAAEGDTERGRFSIMRCISQSSLDESSQRPEPGDASAGAQHAVQLLDALARLRRDDTLCDVYLQAQPEPELVLAGAAGDGSTDVTHSLGAHRAVLAACSPYFRAMFTQFDERTRRTITIQNMEPQALEAIVEYIYNPDSLIVTEDNVQSVLSAASLLQVCGARAACCAFLASALQPDNALGIRAFADLHACTDLALCAQRYVERHFVQVLDTEEFLGLSPDTLAQLLASDRITVPNEEVVLDAVVRWMQHDPEARREHLGALLEHVRLPLLAQETLVARASAEPFAGAPVRVKDNRTSNLGAD